jgi:hypothetical protein
MKMIVKRLTDGKAVIFDLGKVKGQTYKGRGEFGLIFY